MGQRFSKLIARRTASLVRRSLRPWKKQPVQQNSISSPSSLTLSPTTSDPRSSIVSYEISSISSPSFSSIPSPSYSPSSSPTLSEILSPTPLTMGVIPPPPPQIPTQWVVLPNHRTLPLPITDGVHYRWTTQDPEITRISSRVRRKISEVITLSRDAYNEHGLINQLPDSVFIGTGIGLVDASKAPGLFRAHENRSKWLDEAFWSGSAREDYEDSESRTRSSSNSSEDRVPSIRETLDNLARL